MIPPPPRHWLPWYLRLAALGLAALIATYVVALYVYGIEFVDLISRLRPPPDPPAATEPVPAPSEPGVVMFKIGKPAGSGAQAPLPPPTSR